MERGSAGGVVGRRQFVQGAGAVGLALVAGVGRLPVPGQRATPITRIGFLSAAVASSQTELINAFREELAAYGHVEGRTIAIEWRFADSAFDQMPVLAAELVALEVAVIV